MPAAHRFLLLATVTLWPTSHAACQVELRTFGGVIANDAGDVDKDGTPDYVVARGSAAVVISGKDETIIRTLQKVGMGNSVITSLDAGADVDKDGYPDVVVGRAFDWTNPLSQQAGVVRVWSGKDGTMLHEMWGLWPADRMGSSVAMVGDIDGDGHADFAGGGETGPAQQDFGLVLVWSGRDGRLLHLFTGTADPQRLGFSLRGAGDVDADGTPDIIAGSQQRGIARVYSGKTGRQLHVFTIGGINVNVDGIGDANGDGHADLLVASSSSLRVFSGKDGSTLHTKTGARGSAAGDMNRDGLADFLVAAPGTVSGFSGKDGSLLFSLSRTTPGFGSFVRLLGDVNRDGARDFVVGGTSTMTLFGGDLSPLAVDKVELSIAASETQTMFLAAGTKHAGKNYLVLGSDMGTSPGTPLGPLLIPLNPGPYFDLTLSAPNTFIQRSFGALDAAGTATAALKLPPGIPPQFVGRTVHHAFIVVSLFPFSFEFASNPAPLKLVR